MKKWAYYNDNDPATCAWVRELIRAGLIMDGEVDERRIEDVDAKDVVGFLRCHWFCGIAGWEEALRLAGWPADRPVWTGSCPCPPFSSAGKKKSCPTCGGRPIPCPQRTGYFICIECEHAWHADGRHLWPELWRLIRDGRPSVVFGEQVASEDGRIWLAGVRGSLAILDYANWSADLCSAGTGAPNIRQRIWWMAESPSERLGASAERGSDCQGEEAGRLVVPGRHGATSGMAVADIERASEQLRPRESETGRGSEAGGKCRDFAWRMGNAGGPGPQGAECEAVCTTGRREEGRAIEQPGRSPGGFWSDYELVYCRDEKYRRVEPGTFPLASGIPGRVGLLRGYGNAINPHVAKEFIQAYLDVTPAPDRP